MASDGFSSWVLRFFLLGETVLLAFSVTAWPSSWYRPLSITHPSVWAPLLSIATAAVLVAYFCRARGTVKTAAVAAIAALGAVLLQWTVFWAVSADLVVLPTYRKDFSSIFTLTYGCFVILVVALTFFGREPKETPVRTILTDVGIALVVWSVSTGIRNNLGLLEMGAAVVITLLVLSAGPRQIRSRIWIGPLIATICAAAAVRLGTDRTSLLLFSVAFAGLSMWIGARIPLPPGPAAIPAGTRTTV